MQIQGIPVSEGFASGKIKFFQTANADLNQSFTGIEEEVSKLLSSIEKSKLQIATLVAKLEKENQPQEAEIFKAHLLMFDDPEILSQVEARIKNEKIPASLAWKNVLNEFIQMFQNIDDEYLRARSSDLQDIQSRVLANLSNTATPVSNFTEDVILFAEDLTPSQTASLDLKHVKGFITEIGGKTSHSAILARALEIPAISGISKKYLQEGTEILMDAIEGTLKIQPNPKEKELFHLRQKNFVETKKDFFSFVGQNSKTQDGHTVELAANIGTIKDMDSVLQNDAEAVGLYRTEFVFMDEKTLPTQDQQTQIYSDVFKKLGNKKCIIRTLDIGGDKKLATIPIAHEMNPFLGLRAVRLCLKEKKLFKDQIKAILRAGYGHDAWIMVPMISKVEEVFEVKKVFKECEEELAQSKVLFASDYKLGVMIEIPSAALTIETICEHVDFVSIGTNDLIQYTCAVDRLNTSVEELYDPFHPAFLKLMKIIIEGAKSKNKFVGICGSVAHKKELVSYFVGLGVDELSMTAQHILPTRKLLRGVNFSDCQKLCTEVLQAKTSLEAKDILEKFLA